MLGYMHADVSVGTSAAQTDSSLARSADAFSIGVQVQRRGMMIRIVIAVLLIIVLGFCRIVFFFADLGPGESWFSRLALALPSTSLCL